MNTLRGFFTICLGFLIGSVNPLFADQSTSLKLEIDHALGKGVKWLN